jgi:ABC-2 type transport system permease protein
MPVATRVLKQLSHDRRFLVLSLAAPTVLIYMLWVFFDSAETPIFDPQEFIIPVGAFLVHFLTYVLCAIVLVRERTADTLARMFVNGYRQIDIVGGYLMAYTVLATLQSLIVLVEMRLLFDLDYTLTEMLMIYGVMWLLAVISISLGIFISNFARNEGQVFPFIPLIIVPSVFFSGMIIPVSRLPDWASVLSVTTPLYYAVETIQEITGNGGNGWMFLGLIGYGMVVMLLGTFTLRERDFA